MLSCLVFRVQGFDEGLGFRFLGLEGLAIGAGGLTYRACSESGAPSTTLQRATLHISHGLRVNSPQPEVD